MKSLKEQLRLGKRIRVIGIDDSPFKKIRGIPVHVSGIVCSDTRFEGMVCDNVTKDGDDATKVLSKMIRNCKFYEQLNVVLLDGLTFAGFNIVDLPRLSEELELPCMSVMRRMPDMDKIANALNYFDNKEKRLSLLKSAGQLHQHEKFVFQVQNCDPETAGKVLEQLTDTGYVPEALRLAHLINSAIITGESSNRA